MKKTKTTKNTKNVKNTKTGKKPVKTTKKVNKKSVKTVKKANKRPVKTVSMPGMETKFISLEDEIKNFQEGIESEEVSKESKKSEEERLIELDREGCMKEANDAKTRIDTAFDKMHYAYLIASITILLLAILIIIFLMKTWVPVVCLIGILVTVCVTKFVIGELDDTIDYENKLLKDCNRSLRDVARIITVKYALADTTYTDTYELYDNGYDRVSIENGAVVVYKKKNEDLNRTIYLNAMVDDCEFIPRYQRNGLGGRIPLYKKK